jgi:hypothetical protein
VLRSVVGSVCLALLLSACSSNLLPREELSQLPIAVTYWNSDEARRLAEMEGDRPRERATREGVASIESLGRLLGAGGANRNAAGLKQYPGRLCFIDPVTLEITRVHAAPLGSRPMAWSADPRRLLFSNEQGGKYRHIFEYDLDSGDVRRLTTGSRYHSEGTFGPEGRFAYFAWRKTTGGYAAAVYATAPGGGSPRRLFEGEVVEDLSWEDWEDGQSTLIYTRLNSTLSRSGEALGQVVSRSLTAEGEVSPQARALARGREPTLTPDGQWIVYSSPITSGGWRLRRMRLDGSSKTALGKPSQRDEHNPAVSPDGRFVAYVGDDNGLDRLFVRRFDGTGDRILLTDGVVASPVW